jgi:PilZ domain
MTYVEREHLRFVHDAELSSSYEGTAILGHTVNLSRGGLCADLDHALPLGADLELELSLRFNDGMYSEAISLWARIVWCTPLNGRFQVGMSFVNVAKEELEHLEMFLRFLARGARSAARDAPRGPD